MISISNNKLLALLLLFLGGGSSKAPSSSASSAPAVPADASSAAAAAAAEAAAAAARARATQSAADAAAAAAAADRAAAALSHASQAQSKARATPVAWPQAPSDQLPPFPGPGWRSAVPTPAAVATRAQQLLPVLWSQGQGAHKIELTAGSWTAYRADQMGPGIRGVTAWVPRSQVSTSAPINT
jgi:hypothetical protein